MLHAGIVARRGPAGWRGVLIRGPSGAGKSDLALRALAAGFRLVADDRALVWRSGGRAFGRAPEPLAGLCEARGQAIWRVPPLALAPLALVVDLAPPSGDPERLPDAASVEIAGVRVAAISLRATDASAVARVAFALEASAAHAANVRI